MQEHIEAAEIETESGYRFWTAPMTQSAMSEYLNNLSGGDGLSDLGCSATCWCATVTYDATPDEDLPSMRVAERQW